MEWKLEKLKLELKYVWKISRNTSEYKENFIVSCQLNGAIGKGEVAPNIRYNETPENIAEAFTKAEQGLKDCPTEPAAFEKYLLDLKLPNALRFGIESAFVHAHCLQAGIDLFEFLELEKPKQVATCYTLPIMEPSAIAGFYKQYGLNRFHFLKVKINDAAAIDMVDALCKLGNHPIMIDANEAWKDVDELIRFLPKLQAYPIEFIEQPLPAAEKAAYEYLKAKSYLPIMADESVLDQPNFDELEIQFHGINMKLMKAGGYLNGIRILKEAKARGLKTMIGCMVETTLGISSAWNLGSLVQYADLDGCLIVGNDPFHLLKEENGIFYLNK